MKHRSFFLLMMILLAACSPGQITTTTIVPVSQPTIDREPPIVSSTATLPAPTATLTSVPMDATDWKTWSVIPALGPEMLNVYANGQALGRDKNVVSVVGDCESSSDWFLKDFSKGERYYNLGPYANLQETIDYFSPSPRHKG